MISGDGVGLRPLVEADRQRWLELLHDPDEAHYGRPAFVVVAESVVELGDRVIESGRAFEAREPGTFAIVGPDDPERFLGIAAWRFDVPAPLQIADIGYAVHPDSRGRGIARSAIALLVDWLTVLGDGPGLARVQLDHSTENPASCRAALAAGLAIEGRRPGYLPLRGADGRVRRHEVCLHGVVRPG